MTQCASGELHGGRNFYEGYELIITLDSTLGKGLRNIFPWCTLVCLTLVYTHPMISISECTSPYSILQNAQLPGQCDETNAHASCVFLYSCWLNTKTGLIWSFLGPVCTIIVVRKTFVQVPLGVQGKTNLGSVITLQSLLLLKLFSVILGS